MGRRNARGCRRSGRLLRFCAVGTAEVSPAVHRWEYRWQGRAKSRRDGRIERSGEERPVRPVRATKDNGNDSRAERCNTAIPTKGGRPPDACWAENPFSAQRSRESIPPDGIGIPAELRRDGNLDGAEGAWPSFWRRWASWRCRSGQPSPATRLISARRTRAHRAAHWRGPSAASTGRPAAARPTATATA